MKSTRSYESYIKSNGDELNRNFMCVDRALTMLLAEKKLKKSEVIARSGIEIHYAYQIFSGTKTPSRNKVVMLCIGMGATLEETQALLKQTGYPVLYGRNGRDNAIMFGISNSKSVMDINTYLYDSNYEILI